MSHEEIIWLDDDDDEMEGWWIVSFDEGDATSYDAVGAYETLELAKELAPDAIVRPKGYKP